MPHSYSCLNLEAALENRKSHKELKSLIQTRFPAPPDEEWNEVSLDQMCYFFKNPCEFIVRNRLNINLRDDRSVELDDREPFELDQLQQYQLKENILSYQIGLGRTEPFHNALIASGAIPHGSSGELVYHQLLSDTKSLVNGSTVLPKL